MDREYWIPIPEFPAYEISNLGTIVNVSRNKIVRTSKTQSGSVKVGLFDGDKQHTRSLKLLVAQIFVPGRSSIANMPVLLDQDENNCRADNIAWRPKWFAWRYIHELKEPINSNKTPVRNLTTNRQYGSMREAAMAECLRPQDILFSCINERPTYPNGDQFVYIEQN